MFENITITKSNNYHFLLNSKIDYCSYNFSPNSFPTSFSRCFAIFGLNLIKKLSLTNGERLKLSHLIRSDLDELYYKRFAKGFDMKNDKTYLQLLTFSLSALKVLGTLNKDSLEDHCHPMLSCPITENLDKRNVGCGVPQSGNYAMFVAIILLHANKYLNLDCTNKIEEWTEYHFKHMNRFGFWGDDSSMSHLQFQNGYHQYEIFHYLGIDNPLAENAAHAVASLSDSRGRFAPYPGGGGCYDYDAISIITSGGVTAISNHKKLLSKTFLSIIEDQNEDGGFCESKFIRPRSFNNFILAIRHAFSCKGKARTERFRQVLTLQRPKHNRINGAEHWTGGEYRRKWSESNLWDSYFRMLTIARIELALEPENGRGWGFIDYPGIGFHRSLKA